MHINQINTSIANKLEHTGATFLDAHFMATHTSYEEHTIHSGE